MENLSLRVSVREMNNSIKSTELHWLAKNLICPNMFRIDTTNHLRASLQQEEQSCGSFYHLSS